MLFDLGLLTGVCCETRSRFFLFHLTFFKLYNLGISSKILTFAL